MLQILLMIFIIFCNTGCHTEDKENLLSKQKILNVKNGEIRYLNNTNSCIIYFSYKGNDIKTLAASFYYISNGEVVEITKTQLNSIQGNIDEGSLIAYIGNNNSEDKSYTADIELIAHRKNIAPEIFSYQKSQGEKNSFTSDFRDYSTGCLSQIDIHDGEENVLGLLQWGYQGIHEEYDSWYLSDKPLIEKCQRTKNYPTKVLLLCVTWSD